MANIKVRYLVGRKNKSGGKRWYWIPSDDMKAEGWTLKTLGTDEGAAITAARSWNERYDAWKDRREAGEVEAPAEALPAFRPLAGTVDALITGYKASDAYPKNPKTRSGYKGNLKIIGAFFEGVRVDQVTPKRAKKLYTTLKARTPSLAVAVVRMGRMLWKWGMSEELAETNVWEPIKITTEKVVIDLDEVDELGFVPGIWSPAAIAHFVATADRMDRWSVGTAVVVNEWLGQRQGDVLGMSKARYKDGNLRLSQSKTTAYVRLPVALVAAISARLEAELQRQKIRDINTKTILVDEDTGRRWDEHKFRKVFAEIRAEAARTANASDLRAELEQLTFMRLRHTAVVRLAEAGGTEAEISAITGHTLQSILTILERYLVRTSPMAASAFQKRLDHDSAKAAADAARSES